MGDLIATLFEPYCNNGELDGDEVSNNTRNSDKLVDNVYTGFFEILAKDIFLQKLAKQFFL